METYNGLLTQLSVKEKEISLADSDIKLFQKLRTLTPIIYNFEKINDFDSLSFRLNNYEAFRLFNELRVRTEMEWSSTVDELSSKTLIAKENRDFLTSIDSRT